MKHGIARSGSALASRSTPLHPSLLGYSLSFTFETIFTLGLFSNANPELGTLERLVINATMCLACLTAALLSRSLYPLHARPHATEAATAAQTVLGCMVFAVGPAMPEPVRLALFVVLSIACAYVRLCWFELFSRLGGPSAFLNVAVAQAVSSVGIIAFSLAQDQWLTVAVWLALPLSALVCLRESRRLCDRQDACGAEQVETAEWSFPLKPIVLLTVFTFVNVTVRSFMPTGAQGYAAVGVLLAMLPLVLVVVWRGEGMGMRLLYCVSFPLMTAGALSLLLSDGWVAAAGPMLTNGAYSMLGFAITIVFCNASYRYGVNPLWLFGFQGAALYGGKALGRLCEIHLLETCDITLFAMAVVMALSICFALVVTDRGFTETFDIVRRRKGRDQEADAAKEPLDVLVEKCAALARRHSLTRREEEVLFYLAQEMEPTAIAEELCLVESTVRSHIKHIYAKTSVHSRSELLELVRR